MIQAKTGALAPTSCSNTIVISAKAPEKISRPDDIGLVSRKLSRKERRVPRAMAGKGSAKRVISQNTDAPATTATTCWLSGMLKMLVDDTTTKSSASASKRAPITISAISIVTPKYRNSMLPDIGSRCGSSSDTIRTWRCQATAIQTDPSAKKGIAMISWTPIPVEGAAASAEMTIT